MLADIANIGIFEVGHVAVGVIRECGVDDAAGDRRRRMRDRLACRRIAIIADDLSIIVDRVAQTGDANSGVGHGENGPCISARLFANREAYVELHTDVLIVGAGPTGLMLANQLAWRGVSVTIIDRHSGPAQQSRAMAVHARTLEIYSKLGIAEKAIALGARGTGANIWASGVWMARVPVGDIARGLALSLLS
jgi:NADPH-dependent 2,4-dienoyl-CoA reductase/sulfur reductase-like enzyme